MDRDSVGSEFQELDRILITDLLLRCIVGIKPDEREKKQDVVINIVLFADLAIACKSDNIDDTVNYKQIKEQVVGIVENSSFFLVERLAAAIAESCLSFDRVVRVTVRVEKPGALRFAKNVGVEITRSRSQSNVLTQSSR